MKIFKQIVWLVLVALTCVGVASCSPDIPDNPEYTNELVGSWLWDDDDEPSLFTFKRDGSFEEKVWSVEDPEDYDTLYGTYEFDLKRGSLELYYYYYDDTDSYKVKIKGDEMHWGNEDGHWFVLYRQ